MGKVTAASVRHAKPGRRHGDGGGLYLEVKDSGARSWLLRYQRNGREHWMGLGSAEFVPLSDARDQAFELRRQIRRGIDPLEARKAEAAQARITELKGHHL
jgi:Arm DNA-binding domain